MMYISDKCSHLFKVWQLALKVAGPIGHSSRTLWRHYPLDFNNDLQVEPIRLKHRSFIQTLCIRLSPTIHIPILHTDPIHFFKE